MFGFIDRGGEGGEVAHFATDSILAFAVEMELHVRMSEKRGPVRFGSGGVASVRA